MAKGKTFTGLKRGQAAGLVYSVGVDGQGKKQQVVRGLAESVANPQSDGQATRRSILAGASVLAAILREFSDHSVQGYPSGLAGRAQFIKMVASPTTGGNLILSAPWVTKGSKSVMWGFGAYVQISKGTLPSYQDDTAGGDVLRAVAVDGNITAQQIEVWGLKENDIFTAVIPVADRAGGLTGVTTLQFRLVAGQPLPANWQVVQLTQNGGEDGDDTPLGKYYIKYVTGETIHERVENGVKMRSNVYLQSQAEAATNAPSAAAVASYQSAQLPANWMPRDTYLDGADL